MGGPKTELQSRSASVSLVAPVLRRRRGELCYIGLSHVVAPVSFSAAFWEGGWRGAPNKVECEQKQKIECLLQVREVEKGGHSFDVILIDLVVHLRFLFACCGSVWFIAVHHTTYVCIPSYNSFLH